jgi:hypothetical protein
LAGEEEEEEEEEESGLTCTVVAGSDPLNAAG